MLRSAKNKFRGQSSSNAVGASPASNPMSPPSAGMNGMDPSVDPALSQDSQMNMGAGMDPTVMSGGMDATAAGMDTMGGGDMSGAI